MKFKTKNLGDIATKMLDPVVRKKTGLNLQIFKQWSNIVGQDIAGLCVPQKLSWIGNAKTATLLLSSFGANATMVMHYNLEIIERVNRFFGYYAINKIKITQATAYNDNLQPNNEAAKKNYKLKPFEEEKIQNIALNVKDEALRLALLRLGRSIYKNKAIIES